MTRWTAPGGSAVAVAVRVRARREGTDDALDRWEGPATAAAAPGLLARWTRRDAEWLLVRRGSPLQADLERREDCVEDHPASLLAAVYHGTQDGHGDTR